MNRLLIISILIVLTSCDQSARSNKSDKQADKKRDNSTEVETTKAIRKSEKEEKVARFECTHFEFNSIKERSDSLLAFMERAKSSDPINRQKWEQNFFCAFPDSFDRMQAVFGFDNDKGAAPLYDYPKGANVIQYFSQLESIPDSIYYNKYINININGVWDADNIREAFDFAERIIEDTENACKALSKFSDSEIKSVFRFIFDGPHPQNDYNKSLYEKLKAKVDNQDKRLGQLLTESYEKLIAEDDGHGY